MKTGRDKDYSFEHCKQRFFERYQRELENEKYIKWNKMIQNKLINLECNLDNISIISIDKNTITTSYIIKIIDENNVIYCSFEKERNCITTFLPIKSVEDRCKKYKKN